MTAKSPNILWIFGDQMRGQAMSHRGDPNVQTPHLDRLAAEGISFSRAISGTPVCTPFRGALLTGRYPHQSGITTNRAALPENAPTVAKILAAHGYQTAWVGKWHLDGTGPRDSDSNPAIPSTRRGGFSSWWAYQNSNRPFDVTVQADSPEGPVARRLDGYESDVLTDLLLEWIQQHCVSQPDQPFFGVLSVQPPHAPYVAPAEDWARHHAAHLCWRPNVPPVERVRERAGRELAGYYAAIERLDWNVGRIRSALHAMGVDKNTYILFFSDHGDLHGSHGGFRKSTPYEEAINIPLVIGGPLRRHQNYRQSEQLVTAVDLAPTTLGLCGIAPQDTMSGHNFSPLVRGEADPIPVPEAAYLSLYEPSGVSYGMDRPFRGVVTRDGWKYVVLEQQPWLLFNLREDPYELANLAFDRAFLSQRRRMAQMLARLMRETGDSFALPIEDATS